MFAGTRYLSPIKKEQNVPQKKQKQNYQKPKKNAKNLKHIRLCKWLRIYHTP